MTLLTPFIPLAILLVALGALWGVDRLADRMLQRRDRADRERGRQIWRDGQ